MLAASITQATPDPEVGIIVKDPITGQPTGVLKENAIRMMDGVIPKPTTSEKLETVRRRFPGLGPRSVLTSYPPSATVRMRLAAWLSESKSLLLIIKPGVKLSRKRSRR